MPAHSQPTTNSVSEVMTDGVRGWFADLTDFSLKDYGWAGGRLVARGAAPASTRGGGLVNLIVYRVYADHNSSPSVRRALAPLLQNFSDEEAFVGLNFGSGLMRFHKRMINLDVQNGETVDIVSDGKGIPLKDASIDLVITQEVLEHISDYRAALAELERVLRPGGKIYCQLPFQIGFHPGPYDFRRFSRDGIVDLFEGPRWSIQQVGISVGHGTALYRIAVEFVAVTMSALHQVLYKPAKGLAAILLWPIKLFDVLTERSEEKDRIAGGYFVIATRTEAPPAAA